jgi:predicted amidohydrolase
MKKIVTSALFGLLFLNLAVAAPSSFKVAVVQFPIVGNQSKSEFLTKFEKYVEQARNGGASLIIFPELFVLDTWPTPSKLTESQIVKQIASEITPALFNKAQALSRQWQIAILAGSAPRQLAKGIMNTSLLTLPNGKEIYQDKVFLTHWEEEQGWLPGHALHIFDAPWGRTAILVCFDVEFPVLSEKLVSEHPEVILIPSMTESEKGLQRVRLAAQARSIEHSAYVLLSATVGKPTPDWVHFGQSAIFSPWDGPFSGTLREQEKGVGGIVFSELDLAKLRENRKVSHFYPAKQQANRKIQIIHD